MFSNAVKTLLAIALVEGTNGFAFVPSNSVGHAASKTKSSLQMGIGLYYSTSTGNTKTYAGTLTTTDGYSITASMTWKVLTTDTTETTKCAAVICVIGTCVQTMDSAGVVVAATVTDDGNLA